jgi:hypothetical protein
LSSRKDKLWKLSENLLARQSSEKIQKKMRTNGWSALNNILPTTDGVILKKKKKKKGKSLRLSGKYKKHLNK